MVCVRVSVSVVEQAVTHKKEEGKVLLAGWRFKRENEEIFGNFLQLIEKRRWHCAAALLLRVCPAKQEQQHRGKPAKKQNIHNVALFSLPK